MKTLETTNPIDIVVIGAGAAGLVASAEAARRNARVVLLEKNNKTGAKILMSGGTRCNLTHDTNSKGITQAFGHAQRFLQPSVGAFGPRDVVDMFHELGVPTKREQTGKIFPQSDRAVEVRDALLRQAIDSGVDLHVGTPVIDVRLIDGVWQVITQTNTFHCRCLIITAGGRSWPKCGTTGDAYGWLEKLGHTITPTHPALVPLLGNATWMHELSGVTLDETTISVHEYQGNQRKSRPLLSRNTSWLFTHFGYSGPGAMDASRYLTTALPGQDRRLSLDLLPDRDDDQLRKWLSDRSSDGGRRKVASILSEQLPNRLAMALIQRCGYDGTIAGLPTASRQSLIDHLKRLPIPVTGDRGFGKAEVTAGGVVLAEVNPKTMASRIAPGLFIAGEVLDMDGWIGGYNFQAAFSTGRAAAIAATQSLSCLT